MIQSSQGHGDALQCTQEKRAKNRARGHGRASTMSVLHRFTLLRTWSGVSRRLIRLSSFWLLLLIFAVPSSSDITRAPAGGISASGTYRRLSYRCTRHRCRAIFAVRGHRSTDRRRNNQRERSRVPLVRAP